MRSAGAGNALKEQLVKIAGDLGPYPHGQLKFQHVRKTSAPRPHDDGKTAASGADEEKAPDFWLATARVQQKIVDETYQC
jgi:hypothetical protein